MAKHNLLKLINMMAGGKCRDKIGDNLSPGFF